MFLPPLLPLPLEHVFAKKCATFKCKGKKKDKTRQKDQKKLYLKILKQVLDLVPGFSVKVESEDMTHIKEFVTDTWNKLKNNEIKVLAKHWPAFIYEDYQYDPSNCEKGLFHGHLLIYAWHAIYIGLLAARLGPSSKIARNVPQSHKHTATCAQYNDNSSHTLKACKAKMNTSTILTSKIYLPHY
ncbi:hypothetical protein HETIRDRAFT_430180 [Heterobasidion irregulare TC 32-1]|uniref:Uncharacterized protein n=1 Tax=Heterobasidion irregulare (strain TC 32-1) TaxID=747525 RepID=W4JTM9_HETIT|nr:uncharacterized protein HETIRDRAFT_430180 [Heterobasidion irregulare TC 32-1]ETW76917.1 hypothetical protein HETIRDRAFT_430180 [Heterobasidion irregulare TC 32-1]